MPCDGRDGTDERPGGDESGDGCPVAGASVAINNYYASSLNPEKELAEAFASKEVLAVAGAGQTGVAAGAADSQTGTGGSRDESPAKGDNWRD